MTITKDVLIGEAVEGILTILKVTDESEEENEDIAELLNQLIIRVKKLK